VGRVHTAPEPNTLYFVYLPPVTFVQGGAASCQAFCGYHNDISGAIFCAVMPFPGCKGCTGVLSTLDALTSTSSHELCEAITDPISGSGWYDDLKRGDRRHLRVEDQEDRPAYGAVGVVQPSQ
jgi:hypothetical protein